MAGKVTVGVSCSETRLNASLIQMFMKQWMDGWMYGNQDHYITAVCLSRCDNKQMRQKQNVSFVLILSNEC